MTAKSKRCAQRWKVAYATRDEAHAAVAALYRRFGKSVAGQAVYECPAGHWHVGNARVKKRAHWRHQLGRAGRSS